MEQTLGIFIIIVFDKVGEERVRVSFCDIINQPTNVCSDSEC